jgi:hypothetical protein
MQWEASDAKTYSGYTGNKMERTVKRPRRQLIDEKRKLSRNWTGDKRK